MKYKRFIYLGPHLKLKWPALLSVAVVFLLMGGPSHSANEVVWGEFTNDLKAPPGINPPVNVSSSATFFSGHVKLSPNSGGAPTEPQGGGFKLVRSAFGQTVAKLIPYPNFQDDAIVRSKKMLYYEEADETVEFAKDLAAFKYKVKLYNIDSNDPLQRIGALFEMMGQYWTVDQQLRAKSAARIVRNAIVYDPHNDELWHILLDIYYDTAVANQILAHEKMVEAQKASLGLVRAPPGEFQIEKEIELLEVVLPLYEQAMQPYFDLLKDSFGVDMHRIDAAAAAANIPYGYYMFREKVPNRSPYAPLYDDPSQPGENLVPLIDENPADGQPDVLYQGYKDLVLLFNILKTTSSTAAQLAKLYALRAMPDDPDNALSLIGKTQQSLYTDGTILDGIFSESELQNADSTSGLIEARDSWAQGLRALSGVKSFLEGNANPLGLDKEFLALVQTNLPIGPGTNDSYDYFQSLLLPNGLIPDGPLGDAHVKFDTAKVSYEKFRVYQDTINQELEDQRRQFGDRLRSIAGAEYKLPPDYIDVNPAYLTPWDNPGGEIYIQYKNIELANLRIDHNRQEIANLQKQIEIEIERRGKEALINDLIADTYVIFGDMQASLTEEIAYINYQQAAAQEAKGWFSKLTNPVAFIGDLMVEAATGSISTQGELMKGELQAQKERYASLERARVQYLNDQIAAAESEARIKTLLLNMSILAIESKQVAIMLTQEVGRMRSLLDEKAYLERQWEEAEKSLSTRYFADPAHRIIKDQKIIEANLAFDQAQLWVFIMARALDYKWNTTVVAPGEISGGSRNFTADSVFTMRNAEELLAMAIALYDYDKLHNIGARGGEQFVKFSLREDFFGFKRLDNSSPPQVLYYPDPQTGDMVDALTAFRSYLENIAYHGPPSNPSLNDYTEVLRLEFSTTKTNVEGTFFSPGRWNEKIKWLSVKINSSIPTSELIVWLEQSGSGLIRNQYFGEPDPTRPDMLKEEMVSYPTRYWWYDFSQEKWRSSDSFGTVLNAMVSVDPDAPPESLQKMEFHELPSAVSRWILEIPTVHKTDGRIVYSDQISDIEIWFENYYKTPRVFP